MEFNKEGKVNRYKNLDEILKLNISESLQEEFKRKFNKKIYFERNGNCKIGKLIGLEINEQLSEQFYIIEVEDKTIYISCNNSITLL